MLRTSGWAGPLRSEGFTWQFIFLSFYLCQQHWNKIGMRVEKPMKWKIIEHAPCQTHTTPRFSSGIKEDITEVPFKMDYDSWLFTWICFFFAPNKVIILLLFFFRFLARRNDLFNQSFRSLVWIFRIDSSWQYRSHHKNRSFRSRGTKNSESYFPGRKFIDIQFFFNHSNFKQNWFFYFFLLSNEF